MKRFYTIVDVSVTDSGRHAITLDGKPIKTHIGQSLSVEIRELAEHLADEWRNQGDDIKPETMPYNQIINTILDTTDAQKQSIQDNVLGYINTDLLCYRTDLPEDLKQRQEESWDPVLQWFENLSGYQFKTTHALIALEQDPQIHKWFESYVSDLDDMTFGCFQILTALTGSIILALAFCEGNVDTQSTFNAINVEEFYRAEIYDEKKYGVDPIQEKTRQKQLRDLFALEEIIKLQKNI